MRTYLRPMIALLALLSGAGAMSAQNRDIPISNWTVPPYRTAGASSGMQTMADVTSGVGFVGVQPCRIADTRGGGVFTGAYGPPALAGDAPRNFDLNSAPHCTGIPNGVAAYSLNFTVTDTGGGGDLRAWPQDNPPVQVTSVLNWTAPGTIIANAIIVPAGTGGGITVMAAGTGANVLIDINGYFTANYNVGVPFIASGNTGGGMVSGTNASNANGAAGVKGIQGTEHAEVVNELPAGVVGSSVLFNGVSGISFQGSGGAGVFGARLSAGGGVVSSGELGVPNLGGRFFNDVEINGDLEVLMDDTFGNGDITADGTLTLGGSKSFIEPHPTDASKTIRYVCLEGPESGTYFRGRGKFQRGIARIPVPEDFRLVTDAEGLTVQITPLGGMASVGVLTMNLNEIVAQSSRNLEFSYLVQGVRRAFRNHQPIEDAGIRYVRRGTESRIGGGLPPELRRRLIENGTFNPDGTVNLETARRLGWDRIWAEREERPATEPSE